MKPLRTVIALLLSGVSRLQAEDQGDALCSMFAGLLPEMSESDIAEARTQVVSHFWTEPEVRGPVLDLIEGHLALRALRAEAAGGQSE